MNKHRPPAVLTIAILNIVVGSLGLICGACAGISNAALSSLGNVGGPGGGPNPIKDMIAFVSKELPSLQTVEIGRGVMLLLLGIVFLVGGIGLLSMQSWARWLSIGAAVLMIPAQVAYLTYELGYVIPVTEKWQAQLLSNPQFAGTAPPPAQQMGAKVGVMVAAGFFIIHAVAVILVLVLPQVGAAFAGGGRYDSEDDRPRRRRRRNEDEDEDEERPRRRRRSADDEGFQRREEHDD